MEVPELLAEYAGALVTSDIINREDLLEAIRQAIHGEGTHIFYIRGAGGIGKTRLLRAVLWRCQPGSPWHRECLLAPPPENLVDLYHTVHHTREGLAYALRHSLPAHPGAFARFDEAYDQWEQGKWALAGMLRELSTLQERIGEAFVEAINELADQGYRPILALDTAERLLYGEDEIQRRLGLEPERTEALKWLLGILPRLRNAVVLIAGRPEPARLKDDLQALGAQVWEPGPFGLEETKVYFDAVAERARELGWEEMARQIASIPDEMREVIHHYTGGRPILLALMIDYLLVADALLPRMKEPVEEVRQRTQEELESIRAEVERELVRFWMETGREADQAIRALAWAPKGMDAELLARVLELRKDGCWDTKTAQDWLGAIRDLSFVKVRPTDGRVFLHDEMYALFRKHVLAGASEEEQKRIYGAIMQYYEDRILQKRREVRDLSRPGKTMRPKVTLGMPQPPADPVALARATAELWRLMAEEVYYRLQRDPVDGFRTYQSYARESYWSYEDTLERLLYSEILEFLQTHMRETFDSLPRAAVEVAIGGVRRVERLGREGRFENAVDLARRIQKEVPDLLLRAAFLAIRLQTLEAEVLTYLGTDLREAERLLRSVIQRLEATTPVSQFEWWQRDVLLAEAYNVLGYCYRNMGWFKRAVEAYNRAIRQWRLLEQDEEDELRWRALRAQHANTLNNLGWALAELGRFAQAAQVCEDALEMRVELGPAAPVAFTLNTYGMVLVRDDKPHRARVLCSRALGIFRDLGNPRGVGLCDIALAEALRRMAAIPFLYSPEDGAELLRQALQHANDAVDIFTYQVPERSRLVEALIERGCIYRQWAWLRPLYQSDQDPDQNELARRSERDLKQAIEEAGEDLVYRRLDAQVNLAWLYYYVREHERAQKEAEAALSSVPEDYRFERGRPDTEHLPYTFYWFLQGKTHLLLGELAWREFAAGKGLEFLERCGEHYTLALAYDELFAPDFRDLRRALYRVYRRVRKLNEEEFRALRRGMDGAVIRYHLPTPTRMDRVLEDWGFLMGPEVR
jgi:tetratricopeptide (TPR) repeat protein